MVDFLRLLTDYRRNVPNCFSRRLASRSFPIAFRGSSPTAKNRVGALCAASRDLTAAIMIIKARRAKVPVMA
jgi:hypothetical protein